MTDGRFPDRWLTDRRFARLSPEAFVLFVVANTWSASNRTDGQLNRDDLDLFPRWVQIDRANELVKSDLWLEHRDGWLIAGYASTQTTAAQLEAAEHGRVRNRERQANKRLRDRASAAQEAVTRDVRCQQGYLDDEHKQAVAADVGRIIRAVDPELPTDVPRIFCMIEEGTDGNWAIENSIVRAVDSVDMLGVTDERIRSTARRLAAESNTVPV